MSVRIWSFVLMFAMQWGFAQWQSLAPGFELGRFKAPDSLKTYSHPIVILRVNPNFYYFKLLAISELNHQALTAEQWAQKYNLIAVTNAGMFNADFQTHVGFMKNFYHLNNPVKNHYKSVAAFNPVDSSRSPFMIFDLDKVSFDQILKQYQCLIQNLRLIRRPGENRWKQQYMKWSEAALGQDRDGNVLLIFSRAPYSMHDFNNILLKLPINLTCAQHMECGPEASLYLKYGKVELKLSGSFETGFNENDENMKFWPIPNVLGIAPKNN
ncbi:MAG: phosphodiester glycosidase family protein [Caldisericaceae bacterium]|nr:phosphodiester glycosidase family protein [Caldisericaceae bacterium]